MVGGSRVSAAVVAEETGAAIRHEFSQVKNGNKFFTHRWKGARLAESRKHAHVSLLWRKSGRNKGEQSVLPRIWVLSDNTAVSCNHWALFKYPAS
jgi:hypothetical protein